MSGPDFDKYYEHFGVNPLSLDSFNVATTYAVNDIVYHEGWLWQAISSASLSTKPNDWLDDGNSTNINPWKVLYPWEEGSYIIVNKNLIEACALWVIHSFPTSQIIGLDRIVSNPVSNNGGRS